jgi:predicted alpha/beta-fold hydrolase
VLSPAIIDAYKAAAFANDNIISIITENGGHLGHIQHDNLRQPWLVDVVCEFVTTCTHPALLKSQKY